MQSGRFASKVTHMFDYVVIGGGTAGCLLANRLSRSPNVTVALIEAGGTNQFNPIVHVPAGYLLCAGNPLTDWCYHTASETGLNGRAIRYPRGRILGGCSSINGMIYMRGQSRDYDNWAAATGDPAWSWQKCLPYFKKHEDYHSKGGEHHGVGGEWKIAKQRLNYEVLNQIRAALIESGVPQTEDFNRGNNHGCGYFDVNQVDGMRCSSADAFLSKEVRERPNLTIITGLSINKLLFNNSPIDRRVIGCLAVNADNIATEIGCTKELILSAGAVGSPAILQRSAIGGSWLAHTEAGHPMICLEGVGENLQDHLQLRLVYRVQNVPTLNTLIRSPVGAFKIARDFLLKREGPLVLAPSQLGAFVKSQWEEEWPDLQYHIQPLSLDAFGEPLHTFNGITMSVCNLRPTSRGNIRVRSLSHNDQPHIALNYLSSKEDKKKAAYSIRYTRSLLGAKALNQLQPVQHWPGAQYTAEQELVRRAGDIGTTIFHPCGTCKMGTDSDSVVDSRLRLHGVPNLRVVDASIMPSIVSGNTNSPTLMIAERAAEWILKA